MEFFIYISDAKVDMLLSQIPYDAKKKIATEFKFDLKVLGFSRKAEKESDNSRYRRLEAVTTFIRTHGNLGTVDEPDEYIEGSLPMRWGPYGDPDSPLVYLAAQAIELLLVLGVPLNT